MKIREAVDDSSFRSFSISIYSWIALPMQRCGARHRRGRAQCTFFLHHTGQSADLTYTSQRAIANKTTQLLLYTHFPIDSVIPTS